MTSEVRFTKSIGEITTQTLRGYGPGKLTYQPFSFLGWPPFSDTNPTYLQAYLNDPCAFRDMTC